MIFAGFTDEDQVVFTASAYPDTLVATAIR
jgi:hypothetical protein